MITYNGEEILLFISTELKHLHPRCFEPSLVKTGIMVLSEEEDFLRLKCNSTISLDPIRKRCGISLIQISIPFTKGRGFVPNFKGASGSEKISKKLKYCTLLTKGCFVSSLIETGQMVLEKKWVFLRVEKLFLIFHLISPFWL